MNDSSQKKRFSFAPFAESIVWLLFVFLAFIYTFQFDDPLPVYELGPAHWPRMVLGIMLIAAIGLLYFQIREFQNSRSKVHKSKEESDDGITVSANVRIALLFILPIFYTYLIHKMGFLLVTPFFLAGYMWLMGVRKWRTLVIVTVSVYAAIIIVFIRLIFTYLPPGAGVFNTINGMILGLVT